MRYRILKTFKGSQDGRFTEEFEEGTEADLSDYLVSCIPAEWVAPVAATATPPAAESVEQPSLLDRATRAVRKLRKAD